MTFLAPGTAILAAALAVPAVLILYFLKLRRRPVRVSSILFWPRAPKDVQANVPLRMIRPSWLLFLHLFMVGLLCAALGRPAVPGGVGTGGRLVLVIDTSASMSARDVPGGPTRLERAKVRATEAAREAMRGGGRAQVAVIACAGRAALLTEFTSSGAGAVAAIEAAKATDEPGNLKAALELVAALGAADEERSPRVVILGDGSFERGDAREGATTTFERIGPEAGPTSVPASGLGPGAGDRFDNLGIIALAARREERDPAVLRVFVEVLSTDESPRAVPLQVSLDGVSIHQTAIEMGGAPGSPSRQAVSLEVSVARGGVLRVSLGLTDALDADNASSLVIAEPARLLAWLVRPEGADENSPRAGSWLLADALVELNFAGLERLTPDQYASRAALRTFEGVDLVFFDRVLPSVLPPCPSIHFASVPDMEGIGVEGGVHATSVLLWKRSHPILRPLSLDALVVSRAAPLTVTSPAVELATGTRGGLIAMGEAAGHQRLVIGFDVSDSNWPLQASFPVFLASATDVLTLRGEASVGRSVRTGEVGSVQATGPGEIVLEGPEEHRALAGRAERLTVGPFSRAGVYIARGPTATRAVAVNLMDEVESGLGSAAAPPMSGRAGAAGGVLPGRREVWHWLVAAACGLMLVEWLVFARAMRS